jgi:transglutaminase-like putative cysteine protease
VESTVDTVTKPFESQTDWAVRLFHNLDGTKGGNFHKFGDALPIKGDVSLGKKELFELSGFDSSFVRGTSYDEYTGIGWKATGRDSERVDGGTLVLEEEAVYEQRRVTSITVHVLDKETTLLFAGTPLGTNKDAIFDRVEGFAGEIEQVVSRRLLRAGDTYNAIGSESIATEAELRAAGQDYPDAVKERYLQLPESLPERVREYTAEVAAGSTNPYDAALAIESHLRTFPYDMSVPAAPPGRDTVDYFLFDLKAGYFDYNATAMAVMLRTLGIPARAAVGYFATADPKTGAYVVTKGDAYSWVEVFFPSYGWVNFNPTPDRPEGGADGVGEGTSGALNPFEDPDLTDLFNDLETGGDFGEGIEGALNERPIETSGPFPWWMVWTLAGVLTSLVALAAGAKVSWEWGMGSLPVRARYWAKVQRLSGWAGLRSHPEETPREWAHRIGGPLERAEDAGCMAAGFEEERYGRPDLQRIDDDEMRGAYVNVRNALFSRVFRRGRHAKNADKGQGNE